MNKPITILLIEDDMRACEEFQMCINASDKMALVGISNNANLGLELVQTHLPDVIILDLELHLGGGNGLLFLAELTHMQLGHQPYILITTNNTSDVTLSSARTLGADFILAKYEKDYCAQYVLDFLLIMQDAIAKKNSLPQVAVTASPAQIHQRMMQRIQRELDLIGVNPKSVGYQYLADAILLVATNGHDVRIGVELSKKYNKSVASIERGMQNAINSTWQTGDLADLLKYYTGHIHSDRGVPTMMEFIFHYARKIKLDMESF